MAIYSKTLGQDDMRQLTITESFNNEPFPKAERGGVMKVKDEQGTLWKFTYKVRARNRRVLSGHWLKFCENNGVQVGHRVVIHRNDDWYPAADYKIEVIRAGF